MKIAILDREFTFSFRGFGPQYTYETITGKPFEYNSTYALHLLFYATLKFCNLDDFKMSFEEFSEWLYDNPEAEQAMATEIREETERRAARLDKKKSKRQAAISA